MRIFSDKVQFGHSNNAAEARNGDSKQQQHTASSFKHQTTNILSSYNSTKLLSSITPSNAGREGKTDERPRREQLHFRRHHRRPPRSLHICRYASACTAGASTLSH